MQSNLSIWQLIIEASLLVQLVMLVLLIASGVSWYLMYQRFQVFKRTEQESNRFEEEFWSGGNMDALYREIDADKGRALFGCEAIFEAGYRELRKLSDHGQKDPATLLDGAGRSMRITINRELDRMEQHLEILATVGSTSPYVGLFGTVWGIMNSFIALGNATQVTIGLVAPAIAEALIATAMGLFAAIPAVIAYNRFASRVERAHVRFDGFQEEFLGILRRQLHGGGTDQGDQTGIAA